MIIEKLTLLLNNALGTYSTINVFRGSRSNYDLYARCEQKTPLQVTEMFIFYP